MTTPLFICRQRRLSSGRPSRHACGAGRAVDVGTFVPLRQGNRPEAGRRHGILAVVPFLLPRRRVLVGLASAAGLTAGVIGGAVALTGCTSGSGAPVPTGSVAPDADETARLAAADRERALAAQATALAARPGTSRAVAAAAGIATAAHTAHIGALLQGLPRQPTAGASRASGASGASPSTSGTPGTASSPAAAVTAAGLVRAEIAAAAVHQAALDPVSGPLARLVASVAASDAALASTLRRAAE
jgi:hypothetical protein